MFHSGRQVQKHTQDFQDLDLVEIPVEGVAAYWLSLKKVQKGKLNTRRKA
ncbi:MAG: hypothetical protein ACLFMQ_00005 [Desulfohalobiaceae bacterium]